MYHTAEIQEDGTCIIGLKPAATIPLIVRKENMDTTLITNLIFFKAL